MPDVVLAVQNGHHAECLSDERIDVKFLTIHYSLQLQLLEVMLGFREDNLDGVVPWGVDRVPDGLDIQSSHLISDLQHFVSREIIEEQRDGLPAVYSAQQL